MIIQRVIKGIGGITQAEATGMFAGGIQCNWWRKVRTLPVNEVPQRLTARNLDWHQNRYSDPDPQEGNEEFYRHTPFISTTAGGVVRDPSAGLNVLRPAWLIALEFATDGWSTDGYLFHCYLFVLGKPTVAHESFSEELRELNVYTGFSPFQPEGEITAKIAIPPAQIEKFAFYSIADIRTAFSQGRIPTPSSEVLNSQWYRPPEEISNIRDVLA